ncbi:glycosyltransferase family 2 protein [Cellulomonas marina]|uniref:N-acetylglucosaminyl-diphospho-decaprenol L-rhamnosyltransferase n=1 Tax=Cellulomonas marina TaxID=988821 RepID=A0A1I0UZY8_9CELL|nr:glycosyltransferase family 2 protein [Cellulomonas marina]GIG29897.1 dTDP-rhamnosyl transferase [Cellulomonas marina]SFA69410.1 N-acetylglucosaminyl-diphospho-decaprenol L-rhamnosyltransferase [Cellulomonas marina]
MVTLPSADVVRVVCVAYHPGAELASFAATLQSATRRPLELVLVDNGTDHAVTEDVAARYGATLLVTGRNLGYGAAANRGASGAHGRWLVVANTDVEWEPGSLDVLLDAAEADGRTGAAGPALLNPDGTVYPSARELPSLGTGVGHALLAKVWPRNPWTRAYQARQERAGEERDTGWLSGACLAVRREAYEAVGGFDEGYFMFFEDVDLGERLGRAGWRNRYVPAARVQHVGGTSWRDRPAPMIRAHHRSAARYLGRRYPGPARLPLRLALRAGLRVRELLELRAAR